MRIAAFAVLLCSLPALSPADAVPAWRERFGGPRLPAGWEARLSPGASATFGAGGLLLRAPLNAHASLQRRVQGDPGTATACVRPSRPAGVSWCTGLFLYWRPGDWCQMGVIDAAPGMRFYAVETVNGVPRETSLAPCSPDRSHWLRIELAQDGIRYLASADGARWRTLRTVRRPSALSGAPERLAVGKGYGRGQPPYPAPHLANDYADRGEMVVSAVLEASWGSTPADRAALTNAEKTALAREGRDAVGEAVLALPGDPTFARVARHMPAMRRPREVVGVPWAPHDIGVDTDGRLQLGDDILDPKLPQLRFEVGEPAKPVAEGPGAWKRRLLNGWMPVVTLTAVRDGVRYEQTVLGRTDRDGHPTAPLEGLARLWMTAAAGAPLPTRVWARALPAGRAIPLTLARTGPSEAVVCVRVPWGLPEQASPLAPEAFSAAVREAEALWRRALARAPRLELPDRRVSEAWRAWLAYSLLDTDLVNGWPEPRDGAGFYEAMFGYSVALHAIAMDEFGLHDRARAAIGSMLHLQRPDGLTTQNYGLPDQGWLLAAIADHYAITGDTRWLQSVAGRVVRAAEWIVQERAKSPREGVTRGMIPFRPYCDYPEATFGYYGNTACCMGLERAAWALERAGLPVEARRFAEEARRYRADLLRSMDAAIVRIGDRDVLPMEPDTRRLLRDGGYRAGDYYGLVASCTLETGFLPPSDRRAFLVTRFLEEGGGLLAGVSRFGPGGIDHAYAYGYLHTLLRRGDARRYLLGFWAMMAFGMTRDTYSGVEVTTATTGENQVTLPHLYSCTQQLRTLRMALVREEGKTLRIGDAAPAAWLGSPSGVAVRGAPTRFGPVAFTLRVTDGGRRAVATVEPPRRDPPVSVTVRLRHAQGRALASVRVNGRRWSAFAGDVVTLPGTLRAARIEARYR